MNAAGIYRLVVDRGPYPQKFYIGQAAVLRKRRNKHLSELRRGVHKNQALQRAFAKYGESSFKFEVLVICEKKAAILELYEKLILDSYPQASIYNLCRDCVGSKLGVPLSEETKIKIGAGNRGKRRSQDHIDAVVRSNQTRVVSAETRAKMSAARIGNKYALGHVQTAEHRRKSTQHFIGKKWSADQIERRQATRRANRLAQGLDIY